jgi:hypothetical protein
LPAKKPLSNWINCVPGTAVKVPPLQLLTAAGAEPPAMSRPLGSVSLKSRLVRSIFPEFWMVIVNREKEPAGMELGEKDLLMLAVDALVWVKVACVGFALETPWSVSTSPASIILIRLPFTVKVTRSVIVHSAPAFRMPPLNEKMFVPGVPVSVPPQPPTLKFTGLAKTMPLGIVSVNLIPVSWKVLGLINRILMVEAEPPITSTGSKLLAMPIAGAPGWKTVKEALAALALVIDTPPGPVACKLPCAIVLTKLSTVAVIVVTVTDTVHDPGVAPVWAGTVPPLKTIVDVPTAAVTVPP